MTQVAEAPLTNPVPGSWIRLPNGMPAVYVPHEPQYRKNEQTNRDELVGYIPGAHIKRLLSEGAMYAESPGAAPVQATGESSMEASLRAELEQSKQAQEALMEELQSLREKMASDPHVPNAAKRAR